MIGSSEHWTYGYKNKNQLTQAEHFDDTNILVMEADYKYDVFGNRNEKDVTVSGVTTVTKYALDGWDPAKPAPVGLENFDVFAELSASNALSTRYLRGDSVDQLFGRVDVGDDTYWTLGDYQASVRDVIDGSGTLVKSVNFDAFGNITSQTGSGELGHYAWTGRELDVETGLQYNRARYFDSATGRWISQDPLRFDAGDSNLYRYVNNRPTNAIDPSSLQEADNSYEIFGTPTFSDVNAGQTYNKLNATANLKLQGTSKKIYGPGFYLRYKGDGAENIRFMQFRTTHWLILTNEVNKKIGTKLDGVGDEYKEIGQNDVEILHKISDPDNPVYQIDSVIKGTKTPYFFDPYNLKATGIGGVSKANKVSWMFDDPNVASTQAKTQFIMEADSANFPDIIDKTHLGVFSITFFDVYAFDISKDTVIAHTRWYEYAGILNPNGKKQMPEPSKKDFNTTNMEIQNALRAATFDGLDHYVIITPPPNAGLNINQANFTRQQKALKDVPIYVSFADKMKMP